MRLGIAALALAPALAVASLPALGAAAPVRAATAPLVSCTVTSEATFSPGVQMVSVPQSVSGGLQGADPSAGPACTKAADGIGGLAATFTGTGQATCLTDPALRTVDLSGGMTITWKRADGDSVGSSGVDWTAKQVDLGSVVFAGTVTSGMFKGATISVSGLSADAVTSVSGGCTTSSPLTGVRTTDTYLRVTQA